MNIYVQSKTQNSPFPLIFQKKGKCLFQTAECSHDSPQPHLSNKQAKLVLTFLSIEPHKQKHQEVRHDRQQHRNPHFARQLCLCGRIGSVRNKQRRNERAQRAAQSLHKPIGRRRLLEFAAEVLAHERHALGLVDGVHHGEERGGEEDPSALLHVHVQRAGRGEDLRQQRDAQHGPIAELVGDFPGDGGGDNFDNSEERHRETHLLHVDDLASDLRGHDELGVAVVEEKTDEEEHARLAETPKHRDHLLPEHLPGLLRSIVRALNLWFRRHNFHFFHKRSRYSLSDEEHQKATDKS